MISYTYDAVGNRTSVTELDGTFIQYGYDSRYRLTSERYTINGIDSTTNYTYDGANNRLSMGFGNQQTTYSYNILDHLTQTNHADGRTTTSNYDGRGNLTQETTGFVSTFYGWDALDRLTTVHTPQDLIHYTYNAQNQRVQAVENGVTTNYVWDSLSRFGDVLLETDALGTITTSYIYGMEGILAQETADNYQYMLKDAHGSVRLLTDAVDSVVGQYDYTAYGETLTESGTETNYRYNGQQYDSLTGMYSLRARYYVPEAGRFISRDQHEGNYEDELNRYVYVAGNPVMFGDPSGYASLSSSGLLAKTQLVISNSLHRIAGFFGHNFMKGFIAGILGYLFAEFIVNELKPENERKPFAELFNWADFMWNGFIGGLIAMANFNPLENLVMIFSINTTKSWTGYIMEFGNKFFGHELRGGSNFARAIGETSGQMLSEMVIAGISSVISSTGDIIASSASNNYFKSFAVVFFNIAGSIFDLSIDELKR